MESDYLIRVQLTQRQQITSSSYAWNNRARGKAAHCVLQRVVAGRVRWEKEGHVQDVGPGQVILFTHNEESSYFYPEDGSEPYLTEWIGFTDGPAPALVGAIREQCGSVITLPKSSDCHVLFQQTLLAVEKGTVDRFQVGALMYELLLSFFRLPLQTDTRPEVRAHHLLLNAVSRPTNIKEIAATLKVSREHLTRSYREAFGVSPAEALRELRLQRACELLQVTTLDVQEIAVQCGMPEVNTFHRAFRRRFGISPQQFRSS